jgi:hypothetical protein
MGRFRSWRSVALPIRSANTRCADACLERSRSVFRKSVLSLARVAGGALPLASSAEAAIGGGALGIRRMVPCVQ